jgi:DNA-binding NtrC family response regulator
VVRTGNSFVLLRYQPARQVDAAIEGLVGAAPAMRELRHRIAQVAGEGCAVLLLGESGTGKELCARAIHERSGRKGAFVPVNCAAIPEQLAESQLFGHLAGAFTGATQHKGFFRAAHGGTLFLDEIGEMPLTLQPKLLRAIEDQAIVPLGATAPAPCDVRLVAATHRDLPKKVEDGSFRGDLYARLAAFPVHLPPLRERREDILPLLGLQLQPRPDRPPPTLATELVEALLLYDWPFNVRELLKIAEQLRIVGQGQDTPLLDLPMIEGRLRTQAPGPDEAEPEASRPAPTREELVALLTEHQGNISHVAKITGRSRRQVDRWIRQFQLDGTSFRK